LAVLEAIRRRIPAALQRADDAQARSWRESRGVQAEIDLALEMDLPIRDLDAAWANESTEVTA
jgi:hypothetical protein